MAAEIPLAEAARSSIESWRIVDGSLRVRLAGSDEERAVQCVCGRCHWVVETHVTGTRGILAVKCHGCGRRADLPLVIAPAVPR
ncbi:MAG: hypothetical protein E6K18_04665 [Methanobacteriota archaeon]|nr:MAG: hypothetical protein E6K18_04665 [Euryarchaeota archaeon]